MSYEDNIHLLLEHGADASYRTTTDIRLGITSLGARYTVLFRIASVHALFPCSSPRAPTLMP